MALDECLRATEWTNIPPATTTELLINVTQVITEGVDLVLEIFGGSLHVGGVYYLIEYYTVFPLIIVSI